MEAYYVPHGEEESDVSSTKIRKAIREGKLESVRDLLHPRVFERLVELGDSVFD